MFRKSPPCLNYKNIKFSKGIIYYSPRYKLADWLNFTQEVLCIGVCEYIYCNVSGFVINEEEKSQ